MSKKPVVSSSASSSAVLQTLNWMRKHGFRPVPLHPRSKAAVNRDYVAVDYKPPGNELWEQTDFGVGCATGPAHQGPVDIDLDCDEALFFAPRFLPPTPAVFGRASKPRSHMLYRVDVNTFEKIAFNDPITKQTIVEARGDDGHQTVFPGSIHEDTGELIEWSDVPFPEVPQVKTDDLMLAVRKVALATLISRHIWQPGYHNEPTKHLTGLFFYLEWSIDDVVSVVQAVMDYHDDKDKSRVPTIRATYKRGEAGKKISGAGVLRKQLKNDLLVDKILDWAGSPTVNLLTAYNERFAAGSVRGKFRIADLDVAPGKPPIFYQKDDWQNVMATDYSDQTTDKGISIPKSKIWLAHPRRRSFRDVDFVPGQHESGDTLNLWTGWAVEPDPEASCQAWLELLTDVICGGDTALVTWFLHWFANILREPTRKSLTAPVMIGVEGAGKSLLLAYFGRILGPAYTVVTNDEHIHGKFNAHLGHTLLLHSDEALYAGDKKHAGIIRSLITDEFRMFEQKGIDAQQVLNFLRLVLTSNDLYAAPAKPGDRRYTVVDMKARKITTTLRDKVLEEMHSTGPAALFQHLLDMDYDPALARTNVKNDSLLALKSINMNPLEAWWHDTLSSGMVLPDYLNWAQKPEKDDWPDCVSSTGLYVAMTIKLRERGTRSIPSETMLAFQLDKFIGTKLQRSQRNYANPMMDEFPSMVKQMSQRQSSVINMPPLAACREAFERYIGQTIEWPKDDLPKLPPAKKQPHDKF